MSKMWLVKMFNYLYLFAAAIFFMKPRRGRNVIDGFLLKTVISSWILLTVESIINVKPNINSEWGTKPIFEQSIKWI